MTKSSYFKIITVFQDLGVRFTALHANCKFYTACSSAKSLGFISRAHNQEQRLQPQREAGLSLAKYLERHFGQGPSASADLCNFN